jgi:hypothetical protein
MPVDRVRHIAWRQWGDLVHTGEINLPPSTSFASCALVGTIGGGRSFCGIMEVRTRPMRDGQDSVEKFGNLYWNWPAAVFRERLTSVTFAMTTYDHSQTAKGLFTILSADA